MMTNTKEKNIILIGVALITIVILGTFSRSLFSGEVRQETDHVNVPPEHYREITVTELKEKRSKEKKILLIDLRSPDAYGQEHVVDSVNIPAAQLTQNGVTNSDGAAIILIGDDTIRATDFPIIIGFFTQEQREKTFVLTGGFSFWKANNGETISSGDPTSFVDQAKIIGITPEALRDAIAQTPHDFFLLDVRAGGSFAQGHIPGAINITSAQLESQRTRIPVGKKLIVYGATELDGFRAGVMLHDLHFYATSVLYGGFASWQEKGFLIEK